MNSIMDSSLANMSSEEEGLLRVMQISGGIALPMVIKTAIELDLFEIMAKTPGGQFSSFDLASSLPTQNPETPSLIERILRFLANQSILTSKLVKDEYGDSKMLYAMTPVSNNFVRNQYGTFLASILLFMYDKMIVDCWYYLKDAIVEGGSPFNKAHEMSVFECAAKDKRFNEVYNKTMDDNSTIMMKLILEKYNGFEGVKQLIDVGGGLGANLELVVSKYPNIKAINFDQSYVVNHAPPRPGVKFVGGDMFESIPKGDAIFLKWILHNWSDNYCITLLKNCWAALPECGKVVVVEAIIPDPEHPPSEVATPDSSAAIGLDMVMLISHSGGKERTEKEYDALAKEAGFTSIKIVCMVSYLWIMEFYKST